MRVVIIKALIAFVSGLLCLLCLKSCSILTTFEDKDLVSKYAFNKDFIHPEMFRLGYVYIVRFPGQHSNGLMCFPSVTPAPAAGSSPSHGSGIQNGPSSSNSDPHNTHTHYSSDNDDDSETEDEALQKEISRLREKWVITS